MNRPAAESTSVSPLESRPDGTVQAVIRALYYYPVKSCRGIPLRIVELDARGIRNDRRWLIISEDGRFLTQREIPQLAVIRPSVEGDHLILSAPGLDPIQVGPAPDIASRRTVRVWRSECETVDMGAEVAAWLSRFLKTPCRLVTMAPDFVRPVDPAYASPGDQVGFADGFPLLMTSESSLDAVNAWLDHPVPMERFRPNMVVSGPPAFAEDGWRSITIADRGITLRVAKPCGRCVVTTVDQETGQRTGDEPLTSLTRFRLVNEPGKPSGAMFGQNLIHERTEAPIFLNVGDVVECEPRG